MKFRRRALLICLLLIGAALIAAVIPKWMNSRSILFLSEASSKRFLLWRISKVKQQRSFSSSLLRER